MSEYIEAIIEFYEETGADECSVAAREELTKLKETRLLCPGCGTPLEMQDSVWFCPGDLETCEFAVNDWNAAERGEDAPTGRNVL